MVRSLLDNKYRCLKSKQMMQEYTSNKQNHNTGSTGGRMDCPEREQKIVSFNPTSSN